MQVSQIGNTIICRNAVSLLLYYFLIKVLIYHPLSPVIYGIVVYNNKDINLLMEFEVIQTNRLIMEILINKFTILSAS